MFGGFGAARNLAAMHKAKKPNKGFCKCKHKDAKLQDTINTIFQSTAICMICNKKLKFKKES